MKLNRNVINLKQDLIIDGQLCEGVQNFRCLGTMTKERNKFRARSVQVSEGVQNFRCLGTMTK